MSYDFLRTQIDRTEDLMRTADARFLVILLALRLTLRIALEALEAGHDETAAAMFMVAKAEYGSALGVS